MKASEIFKYKKNEVNALFAEYPEFTNVRLFGSVAYGTDTKESDIDFLVDTPHGYDLLELNGLCNRLEDLLGIKADVVIEKELYPFIARRLDQSKMISLQ